MYSRPNHTLKGYNHQGQARTRSQHPRAIAGDRPFNRVNEKAVIVEQRCDVREYEKVYLPLREVADTPFHIQEDDLLRQ